MAIVGCGPSAEEQERLKSSMLRQIGIEDGTEETNTTSVVPVEPNSAQIKSFLDVAPDQVEHAWMSANSLPMEDWEIQYLGNEPAGFFYRKVERAAAQEPDTLRLTARSRTRLRGREKEIEQKFDFVAFERENGDVIRFEGTVEVGSRTRRFEGAVRDSKLEFNTNLYGRGDSIRIIWNALDRGPFAIEQSLMRAPMKEGEQRQVRYFDPLFGGPIDAQLTAYDYFDTPTFDGKNENLLEIQITSNNKENASNSQIWADRQGRIHKRFTPAIDLRSFRCSKESAMVVVDQSELADLTLRPIPLGGSISFPITSPTRFRIETIDAEYSLVLPSRTHQVVRSISNRKVDVTVYSASELNNPIDGIEQEDQPGEELLANSFVIDAKHPAIQRLAEEILKAENLSSNDSKERRASAFSQGISTRVKLVPFDRRVSAGHNTLASGQGDSFDLAALLAATCRSNGIPTRIAIGLQCDTKVQPLAMGLHAWTEIHDGQRWIPMDASTPDSASVADRIKWSDSMWSTINPYESILQLARHLSMLEVSVARSAP